MLEVENSLVGSMSPVRFELETLLAQIPGDFEGSPHQWLGRIRARISTIAATLPELAPQNREYLQEVLAHSREIVREQISEVRKDGRRLNPTDVAARFDVGMMNLSRRMAEPFDSPLIPTKEHFVPLDRLVGESRGRLRINAGNIDNTPVTFLEMVNPSTNIWYPVALPLDDRMWHKGGPARAAIDIYAKADDSMLSAELPFNDYDALCIGDEYTARRNADIIGISPDGVEMMHSDFNFSRYATSRDTNQNCVLLGRRGLHFSEDALLAAATGHIKITGAYIAEKAIYNNDKWTWKDADTGEIIDMPKQRGMMRVIKCVAEGKAKSLEYKPITDNLDFGIYSLYLAKRWSNKPNFPELVQNLYVLMKQINQTQEGEENIMDVLERVHKKFPFFDINGEMKDMQDVVRWKSKKLIKQLDREAGWKYGLSSGLMLRRRPFDTAPQSVGLNGFKPDPEMSDKIKEWWPQFGESCIERTSAYEEYCRENEIPSTTKYFYVLETGLMPDFVLA